MVAAMAVSALEEVSAVAGVEATVAVRGCVEGCVVAHVEATVAAAALVVGPVGNILAVAQGAVENVGSVGT